MEDVLSDLSMTPRECPIPCCGTPLVGSPVVLSPVTKVLLVDAVPRAHLKPSLCTDQGQVFIDCDTAVIEKDVMVGPDIVFPFRLSAKPLPPDRYVHTDEEMAEILYLEQASKERQIVEDWEGPIGWHLETVGKWLTEVYPWESVGDAMVFLVSGKPPRLAESLSAGINMGNATYSITFAPWVSEETVSRAYRETQHSRHRLPQDKTIRVLRFVSEQTDEEGRVPSWSKLLDLWNAANPDDRFSDRSALHKAYRRAVEALVIPYFS